MKEGPWENNALYFYLCNEKKQNCLVPVKEIDFHVHRGVSFHIKDAEM